MKNVAIKEANIKRKTNETDISCSMVLRVDEESSIDTGIGFFDHMLHQLGRHGLMKLDVKAVGDLFVDGHHLIEDVGITLGKALSECMGDKSGIKRYGSNILPMDDALICCALDLSGRVYYQSDVTFTRESINGFDLEMVDEFFRALCQHAGMNLHFKYMAGVNNHHMVEGMFKAFAKALMEAVSVDPYRNGVLSTKGLLEEI